MIAELDGIMKRLVHLRLREPNHVISPPNSHSGKLVRDLKWPVVNDDIEHQHLLIKRSAEALREIFLPEAKAS